MNPDYKLAPRPTRVWDIDDGAIATLKSHGVDTQRLLRECAQLSVNAAIQPDSEFWTSEPGRRATEVSLICSTQPAARPFLILLAALVCGGPAARFLSRAGLCEALLLQILEPYCGPSPSALKCVDHHLQSANLSSASCLGRDAARLTRSAQTALCMAWDFGCRQEVQSKFLLRALVDADLILDPLGGAVGILHRLGALQKFLAHRECHVALFEGSREPLPPTLTLAVRQALQHAFAAAGDGPVSTAHILLGLASLEQDEASDQLASLGVTPR